MTKQAKQVSRETTDAQGIVLDPNMILETTVARRAGGKTFQERLGDFPMNAIVEFLEYGFQRKFNDAIGGKNTTTEDKVAAVAEMIARFKQGIIGRVRREAGDPFVNECRKIVTAWLRKNDKVAYAKLEEMDDDAAEAKLDEITAANAWVAEKAQANIDARREAATVKLVGVSF